MNDPSQMTKGNFGIRHRPIEDPLGLGRPRPVFFAADANTGRSNQKNRNPHDHHFYVHPRPRRFFYKKKSHRFAPLAPLNTTSFLIRAKKSGGIASIVSPSPLTPAILPTPKLSPSREFLVDMAKEEWGVDGYGSMNGLIRLRSRGEEENTEEGSSGSDVEERGEVERRLDHDLSRFEMVYPEAKIARLEEENLTLEERLFVIQSEMRDLSRRLRRLETRRRGRQNVNLHHNSSGNNSRLQITAAFEEGESWDEVSSMKSRAD